MTQRMLAIWSLVPLPFLNPAWTSGSSWFMYCWRMYYLENFKHLLACVRWLQLCSSLSILWHCFSLGLEWKLTFSSPVAIAEFSKFADIECSTFTASSFRIWNSSTGIPSPPLALVIVMLPKAHFTSLPRCLALGEWSHHHDYLGCEDLFCTVLLCILATSS